jgi:hypothetical protein
MKESYKEDFANHFGLELYADEGNVMGVATTEGYAGKLLSSVPHPYRSDSSTPPSYSIAGHYRNGTYCLPATQTVSALMRRNFNRENRETLSASEAGQQPSSERLIEFGRFASERRRERGDPLGDVGRWLGRAVRGWQKYFAVPGNMRRLRQFADEVSKLWYRQVQRRSQRFRWTWSRMRRIIRKYLPRPKTDDPYPEIRFLDRLAARAV